jgi:pSer/pThr/pTyr-binding forkhead associated (FHA) protein
VDDLAHTALEVMSGREQGVFGSLAAGEILLGRDPDCDLVLTDPRVSRRHARIWVESGLLLIEDAESTSGTLVNGAPIERAVPLRLGDLLQLGTTEIAVRWIPAPAATMIGVVPPELRDTSPITATTAIPAPLPSGPEPLAVPDPLVDAMPVDVPPPPADVTPIDVPPPPAMEMTPVDAPPPPSDVTPFAPDIPPPPLPDEGPPTAIASAPELPPPPGEEAARRADSFPPLPPPWTAPEAPKKPWFKRVFGR